MKGQKKKKKSTAPCRIWHICYFSDTQPNQGSFMTEGKSESNQIINSFNVFIEIMVIITLQFSLNLVCKFPDFVIKLI